MNAKIHNQIIKQPKNQFSPSPNVSNHTHITKKFHSQHPPKPSDAIYQSTVIQYGTNTLVIKNHIFINLKI